MPEEMNENKLDEVNEVNLGVDSKDEVMHE